ncbi:MAG: PEGA domain-containing protein [Chitinivibrionales bacterium]|nr:PEGA domain-containing protein [Chitinivibrionales bacterium]
MKRSFLLVSKFISLLALVAIVDHSSAQSNPTSGANSILTPSDKDSSAPTAGKRLDSIAAPERVPVPKASSNPATGAPRTGKLRITTVPDSAIVSLDEVVIGKSPLVLDSVSAGTHILILKKKGYFQKKVTIEISEAAENALSIELVQPATLVISSDPSSSTVFFNNEQQGRTPFFDDKIKPGDYTIRIGKSGYENKEYSIQLGNGQKDSLHVVLIARIPSGGDSVEQQVEKLPPEKKKMASLLDTVALAAFVVFSAVIILIEFSQNK